MSSFKKFLAHATDFFHEKESFNHDSDTLPVLYRFVRFWIMVGKKFWKNRCPLRASALAYTTLLALIPILAVGISISTSLLKREGGKQQIEQMLNTLVSKVAPQLDLVPKTGGDDVDAETLDSMRALHLVSSDQTESDGQQKVVESISNYINRVSSGTLGATAMVALIFVAISLLSTIEATINDIWGVSRGRSFLSRTVQYWAVITLGPIFLLLAMGLNFGPYFQTTQRLLDHMPFLGNFIFQFLPMIVLALIFTFFYQAMPNTKVQWRAALVGGMVGGLLWHLNNVFSVVYLGQVSRNSQIYGQLAIVPIFLLGIYLSWMIVLFGAQVAYVYQNRHSYVQEKRSENVNERGREFIALRLMTLVAQKFHHGQPAPDSSYVAESLCVPAHLVRQIVKPLLHTGLLTPVATSDVTEIAYAPGRPLDKISYQNILDAVRAGQGNEIATRDEPVCELVRGKFQEIRQAENAVAATVTLQNLVVSEKQLNAPEAPQRSLTV
ncbi:MAG: YhjD/YihY/BrkB family envelope integrity protein [Verrucomicrobiota bacterium]